MIHGESTLNWDLFFSRIQKGKRTMSVLLTLLCLFFATYPRSINAHNNMQQTTQIQVPSSSKFKLITTLYHETNETRCLEYITCIEKNLQNPLIDTIYVIYETTKDKAYGNKLLDYLKSKKIKITYTTERPSYGVFFELANKEYPNSKVIVSNADIFFNETLNSLTHYDLRNKFLALTRWNVAQDGTLTECSPRGSCQDTWIFQTPLPPFENTAIKLGTWGCEHAIAYQAQKSGLFVANPSRSIQCCHLHLSEYRAGSQKASYENQGKISIIPKCTIMELDEQCKALYISQLRLRTGRRIPIILDKI